MRKLLFATLLFTAAFSANANSGFEKLFASVVSSASQSVNTSYEKAPGESRVENAFSPDGGAEALVLKTINSAQSSIRLAGYSFTSPAIVAALVAAKKRGVDVRLVVDYKNNLQEGRNNKGKVALDTVVNAGIPSRTISVYPIFHDKTIIVDQKHVLSGSFNFSQAAAKSNSENVIVLWNYPTTATSYLKHWEDRWSKGRDYSSSF